MEERQEIDCPITDIVNINNVEGIRDFFKDEINRIFFDYFWGNNLGTMLDTIEEDPVYQMYQRINAMADELPDIYHSRRLSTTEKLQGIVAIRTQLFEALSEASHNQKTSNLRQ